jgi:hypothetical protein
LPGSNVDAPSTESSGRAIADTSIGPLRAEQRALMQRAVALSRTGSVSGALQYFVYNFIRHHRTLRMGPAMAAGAADKLWEVSDLVALLEAAESKRAA